MTLKHLLVAASAAALVGGAAYAQDAMSPAPKNDSAPMQDATGAPADTMPSGVVNPKTSVTPEAAAEAGTDASAMAPAAPAASESGTDAAAVVQPRIVANAPIPDTPENREMYGEPLSHAGKRSAANGH